MCVTLLTVLLAAVGTDWSARQAQRYFAEMEETYGSGIRPGTVITYAANCMRTSRARWKTGRAPLSAFEEQDWRDIPALYIPQEDELFCQFYTVAAVLVFSLALAAGLLGALWRRLGLGAGLLGQAAAGMACVHRLLHAGVLRRRRGLYCGSRARHVCQCGAHAVLFRCRRQHAAGKSRGGGVAVAGCFFVFEAGAALGAGLRDGFWRYLPAGAFWCVCRPLWEACGGLCAALPLWICAAR